MAWQDRPYHRDDEASTSRPRLTSHSMVTWLLVANFVIWVLDEILTGSSRANSFSPRLHGAYVTEWAVFDFQIWRFFTYQFLHQGFWHIAFNMLGLFFFGPMLESWFGSRRFLAFYLLCGVAGAVLFSILEALGLIPGGVMVGASACIFGILIACATLFPHEQVRLLFPPVPMRMRTMAMLFLGISIIALIVGSRNAAGEAAHLGGAAMGFVFARFPWLLNWADFGGGAVHRLRHKWHDRRKQRQKQQAEDLEAEVDRILAKVKAQGLHSLTEKEKRTLQRATEKQRWAG